MFWIINILSARQCFGGLYVAHSSPVDDHWVYRLVGLEAAAVTTTEMCPGAAHLKYTTWMLAGTSQSSLLETEMQHSYKKKQNDVHYMFFI